MATVVFDDTCQKNDTTVLLIEEYMLWQGTLVFVLTGTLIAIIYFFNGGLFWILQRCWVF